MMTLQICRAQEDGYAAYNFLIDSMNINPSNIFFVSKTDVESIDLTEYDLIFNHRFTFDVTNLFTQNVPFVTTSVYLVDDIGIGTTEWGYLHESRDFVYIHDSIHPITVDYTPGLQLFVDSYVDGCCLCNRERCSAGHRR